MIKSRILLAILLLGAAGPALAGSAELNLSSDAVKAAFASSLTRSGLQFDASYLHNEDKKPQDHDVAALGLHLVDDAQQGKTPFTVGIGAKLFMVDVTAADGGALGVGGFFRYTLPSYNRFGIGGDLYYAPKVVSFGGQERYSEAAVRLEYEILRNANVYLGYRRIRADFDTTNPITVDNGLHFGLRIDF